MNQIKDLIKKHKFILIILFVLLITGGIGVYFLTRPPRITIQNYNDISSASNSTKAKLEEFLYRFLDTHHNNIKDLNDVYIRNDSYNKKEDDSLTSETFLLDINSLKITYQVSYTWSDKTIVPDGIIIDCPKTEDTKFPESKCVGMYNTSEEMALQAKYPLITILPIEIDEYTDNYSTYINYRITYTSNTEDSSVTITITDLSGGNYDRAIKKITELGYNPADYTIKYQDESSQNYWPRLNKY